jgi:ribosomal protein S18 acetylase RimI-like enzyme
VHKIEPLSKSHDRESFDCGSEPLNLFLRQTARQHAERGISKTFVLVEDEVSEPKIIFGYFTLNICQIKSEVLPEPAGRRLPRDVAAVKLGRLAVAKHLQRRGIGKLLLVAAMQKVIDVFQTAGGIGLFVDAKDQAAKHYYERFGFVPLSSNDLQLFLPLKTISEALLDLQR